MDSRPDGSCSTSNDHSSDDGVTEQREQCAFLSCSVIVGGPGHKRGQRVRALPLAVLPSKLKQPNTAKVCQRHWNELRERLIPVAKLAEANSKVSMTSLHTIFFMSFSFFFFSQTTRFAVFHVFHSY